MTHPVDAKTFWEAKILEWETGRYAAREEPRSLLERIANRASDSLRFRLAAATALLGPAVQGRRVVELGCGSGLIAADLIAAGAASYHGYDIAENAVETARTRAVAIGISDRARFDVCPVADLPPLEADVVVSLGLFDWLDDDELVAVFRAGGKADYLHAIAERRPGPIQWMHRVYVHLAYGHRTGAYVPRYFTTAHIGAIAERCGARMPHVFRDPRLSFGAFLMTLPLPAGALP